jgi:hypothetical protein
MNPMVCQFAAVTVAVLYCSWRRHHDLLIRKQRVIRERVALMLWAIAQGPDEIDSFLPAR